MLIPYTRCFPVAFLIILLYNYCLITPHYPHFFMQS